jgi:hypothetical protein
MQSSIPSRSGFPQALLLPRCIAIQHPT